MAFDLVLSGGLIVDGTGAPAQQGDIGLSDGRIVEIAAPGRLEGVGGQRIDVEGQVIAPGFIDIHTHMDAQVLWDPACTPVPFHGVTTLLGGNCGFSVAPLVDAEADYVVRMLAEVEEIPLDALYAGVDWKWRSTAEYLDHVEAVQPAVNIGFLAGHSTLRRAAMGEDCHGPASAEQIDKMRLALRESLAAGALGFSSSHGVSHFDGEGKPVPSVGASLDETVALAGVAAEFPGTQIQYIGTQGEPDIEMLIRMSLAANRPANWNLFIPRVESAEFQLNWSDLAAARGARVLALMYPGVMTFVRSLIDLGAGQTRRSFRTLPGWAEFTDLPPDEMYRHLSDPAHRTALGQQAATAPPDPKRLAPVQRWADYALVECFSDETRHLEGQRIGDIAERRGRDPWDVFAEVLLADRMRTRFEPPGAAGSPEEWELRKAAWQDPRVIIGGSDAGAHVTSIATWDWATEFLALNREHATMPLEDAVHRLTGVQAELYGLAGRGRIAEGFQADIVVFDKETIAPGPVRTLADLPGGSQRLSSRAEGMEHVLVNGRIVVSGGELTGAQPGTVLRSGRDTRTVALTG